MGFSKGYLRFFLLSLTLFTACGYIPDPNKNPDEDSKSRSRGWPAAENMDRYDEYTNELEDRLLEEFVENGYVVSREANGDHKHAGDAAKYTGIALGVLPCDKGHELEQALKSSLMRYDGQIQRFEPPIYSTNYGVTSRDAEVGVTFGFVMRNLRCGVPFSLEWQEHWDFVEGNNWHLEPPSEDKLSPGYLHVFGKVKELLAGGNADEPASWLWQAGLWANVETAESAEEDCFPVDLTALQMCFMSKMGYNISEYAASKICAASRNMGLAHMDWYCRRGVSGQFLEGYPLNRYENRLQICPWQDGTQNEGVKTHAVDYLLMKFIYEGGCNA